MIKVENTRFKAGEGFKVQGFGNYSWVDSKDIHRTKNELGTDETLFICVIDTMVYGDPTIPPVTIFEIVGQGFVEVKFKDNAIESMKPVYKIGHMYHLITE